MPERCEIGRARGQIVARSRVAIILWIIISSVAWTTGRDLLFHLSYLLLATIVVSFLWAMTGIHWARLTRQTKSRRTQVNQVAEERFSVQNTSFLPKLWLEVRDHSELPGHRASRVVNSLAPRRQRAWMVRTICLRRGRFRLGPITLASGDPFGLFRMERQITPTSSITVFPATVDLPGFLPPIGQLPGGEAMRRRTHYVTTNVSGIREYAPGDSFNRIHWLSTARTGQLMVKEFELDPMADVWILLDLDREVQRGEIPPEQEERASADLSPWWISHPRVKIAPTTEEYGVTIAASVAKHFLAQNKAVGMIVCGQRREVLQLDRGERQLTKILDTLATIEARGRTPLHMALATEAHSLSRSTILVVITPSTYEQWVFALRDLRRQGVRSVVILIEPSTFGEAPGSLDVVSTLAAAEILTYLVKNGDSLSESLSYHTRIGEKLT